MLTWQAPLLQLRPTPIETLPIRCSFFDDEPSPAEAREERLRMIASQYQLDLDKDWPQIANIAASSLPEEENGTWADVAFCTLRNMAILGAGLTALGSIPGEASAASMQLQGLDGGPLPYDPAADPAVQELQRSLDLVRVEEFGLVALLCFVAWRSTRPDFVIDEFDDEYDDRRRW